ncbi:hypothetical protein [Agromyces larvae]|uniref:L-lactate permease n=1 Tax=Agromyces larvae TaxID=2929802 RepID=A0ABY4C029_9MICO|nr:hypothetical protein [Agromyces larvae]UOE44797.1 hypothetical protein MTO99_03115 [Agromyces larvae]
MNTVVLADAAAWVVLVPTLIAAAGLSVLAYFRPNRLVVWIAAAALGAAVVAAASLSEPARWGGVVIALLALTTGIFGGGPAAGAALSLAMGSVSPGLHGGILIAQQGADGQTIASAPRREVLRGGQTIGVLERIATAGTIIAGFPEGLAIVVAVKGVGRFTELDAPEARERFIIGTFASLIWACAAGLVAHFALR